MHYIKSEIELFYKREDVLCLKYGSRNTFNIYKDIELFLEVFHLFEIGVTQSRWVTYLDKIDRDNIAIVEHFFRFFKDNNLLTSKKFYGDHDRQIRYFSVVNSKNKLVQENDCQLKIYKSSILVVGLGGIGTYLTLALASSGVRKIGIMDFDIIEDSNISRGIIYNKKDIGKYKADVLSVYMNTNYPDIDITSYLEEFKPSDIQKVNDYQFVAFCIDKNSTLQNALTNSLIHTNIPFIYSNYGNEFGLVTRVQNEDNFTKRKNRSELLNKHVSPSTNWNSMIIAGIACKEIIGYITDGMASIISKNDIFINLNTLELNIVPN